MSAVKPATATPVIEPSKPLAINMINMPKLGGKGGKILGTLNNVSPQVTGKAVSDTLKTMDKLGVKDNIEEKIKDHDFETPAQIAEEEKKITRRIFRIDLIISYLLFYTALMMQWLTLLGLSNNVGGFFYEFFINSFNFPEYNFSSLTTVGKIAGFSVSLQIIIFVLVNIFVLGKTLTHKNNLTTTSSSQPSNQLGNRFQFIDVLKNKLRTHFTAVRRIDTQFYQIMGILSQILIIIAAIISADDKFSAINKFTDQANNLDPSSFPLSITGGYRKRQEQAETQEMLIVRHAALFTKTITSIAILAIIMTSFMNIITYEKTHEQEDLMLVDKANRKPQSAEKLLIGAQQNVLKNPNMNDLIKVTLDGPTKNDIEKISGEEKFKNGEKKDLNTLVKDGVENILDNDEKEIKVVNSIKNGIDVAEKISDAATSGEGGKPNIKKLATEGVQAVVTATGVDKNPTISQIKTATEIGEKGKLNVEKLVTEGKSDVKK
ncbi:4519_t:CDS:2 [Rhizophagus irregularis]|nr:4519_t:CDS:2 [Rhizophagus irregularis]